MEDLSHLSDLCTVESINNHLKSEDGLMTGTIEILDKDLEIGKVASSFVSSEDDEEVLAEIGKNVLRWIQNKQILVNIGPLVYEKNVYVDCIAVEPYFVIKRRD